MGRIYIIGEVEKNKHRIRIDFGSRRRALDKAKERKRSNIFKEAYIWKQGIAMRPSI